MKNFKKSGVGSETGVSYQNGWNEFFAKYAEDFYDIATQAGFDPRYIVAIGVLESGWGTSDFAQNRTNTFGYAAYDGSASENAVEFPSQTNAIDRVCKTLEEYEKPGTWQYERIKSAGYDPSTIEGKAYLYANGAQWGDSHVQEYAKSIRDIIKQIFGSNANISDSSSTDDDESDNNSSDGSLSLQDLPPGATVYETSKGLMWCPDGIDGIPGGSGYNGEAYAGDANERMAAACELETSEIRNRTPHVQYSVGDNGPLPSTGDIVNGYKKGTRMCCATYMAYGGDLYNFFTKSSRFVEVDAKDVRPGDLMLYAENGDWQRTGHAYVWAGNGKIYDQRSCAVRENEGQTWSDTKHTLSSKYLPGQPGVHIFRCVDPAYDTMQPIK